MEPDTDFAHLPYAPGPKGRPVIGSLAELAPPATRLQRILGWTRDYGDIVRVKFGSLVNHIVVDPSALQHVLVDHAKNYPKSPEYDKLRGFLGDGLFTASGETWLRHRRMMQPYFHQKYLRGLVPPMVRATRELLASWEARPASEPFDVAADMMALTMRIVGLTLLGSDVSQGSMEVGGALGRALEITNRRFFKLVEAPAWLPTRDHRVFAASKAKLDAVVYEIIAQRRSESGERNDLLGMLLDARDEESGDRLDDRQLRDEVMTLFLAGHETTAAALAWTFYLLSLHPDCERKLHAELVEVLGDREPGFDDLPQLRYTGMVFEEALRCYPPVFVIQRIALADDALGGYRIRAGERVTASINALHHNPRLWENPEGFDPERFTPERVAARHRFAYLPFGGGGRVCIGNGFAMMEAKVILAMIGQACRLALVPGLPVTPLPQVTLRPKPGVVVRRLPRPAT